VTVTAGSQYKLVVRPDSESTGTYSTSVVDIPFDATTAVTVGATPQTSSTTVAAQNAVFTFDGSVGQRVAFNFTGGSFGGQNAAMISVVRPDGGWLIPNYYCGTSCWFEPMTLPATGTYKIVVDPQGSATGSLTAQLYDVPTAATATVTVGGPLSRRASADRVSRLPDDGLVDGRDRDLGRTFQRPAATSVATGYPAREGLTAARR
jgi:hypothetical protein